MTEDVLELVRRAQTGDRQAFASIYEAYFDRIYRYLALRVGNPTDAEDLTEQVFLRTLESIDRFEWRGVPFAAWLFQIASNQAIDHFRRRSRQQSISVDEEMPDTKHDPAQEAVLRIRLQEVQSAMQALTDLQRHVIALRFGADLPIAEVGQIMDRTPGAVKALQHAAIVSLRNELLADQGKTGG
jgi:RNA polymerase sigma-70 factor (ECF subfamily)